MKRLATVFFVITTFSFASNDNDIQNKREMRQPPQEAITICKSKSQGDSCSMTTPRGDKINGTCENTPDGKYFACKPENMGNNRPPSR